MKSLRDNLPVFVVAIIMVISPMQYVYASVSKCMTMDNVSHMQMQKKHTSDMQQSNLSKSTHDCCLDNLCDLAKCGSVSISAVIPTSSLKDYPSNSVEKIHSISTSPVSFYLPSLYRPPRT